MDVSAQRHNLVLDHLNALTTYFRSDPHITARVKEAQKRAK
jgi:hypothetical protein